jgi:hypothetical protein
MKTGYGVEGSTDRAFLAGLRQRWCPRAELVEGRFRGTSGLSLRREIPKICIELSAKSCMAIMFLTDANRRSWRNVKVEQKTRVPQTYHHLAIVGVSDPNIEAWICADAEWFSKEKTRDPAQFMVDDPKGAFESALGINSRDRKETEIANLVERAPLKSWISKSPSFEEFYEDVRQFGKRVSGCRIRDER